MRTRFSSSGDTPYGVPPFDKIRPEHYVPAFERAMSLNEAEVEAIASNNDEPTFENTLLAFDDAGRMLAQVELVFGMICAADTNEQLQAVQEQIMPRLAAHYDRILMNDRLFGAGAGALRPPRNPWDSMPSRLRLLEKTYRGFVRAGALLDAEQKERLKQINADLSVTGVKFGNNVLAENAGFALEPRRRTSKGCPSRCVTLRTRRPCSAV